MIPQELYRLVHHLWALPQHYEVVCEPDFDNDKLILTQKITFEVSKADCSNQPLFINAKQPTIHKSQIDNHLVDLQLAKDNPGKQYDDVYTFTVPEELQNQLSNVGQTFVLDVNADMCISTDLEGAYYSYSKVDGQPDQKLLVTQFESHYARKSFICVDEPEAKSTFNFKFIVPDGLDVLFNTPSVGSKKQSNGKTEHLFETTPILSTYLVAFAIGKFEYHHIQIKNSDESDIDLYFYCPSGNKDKIVLPLKYTGEYLKELIKIFGPYPVKRVAHLALPDFRSGAMENNGLITYRDSHLYVSEDSGFRARRNSGLVITHEMSHFYFGNLVTMKWWDDLWLNESFATAVMYLIAEATHKRLQDVEYFEPMQSFIDEVKVAGMNLDSLESTHPVKSVITKPDQIETIFDAISYNKGAAVIMQLIDYVGEEIFFAGIRNYLSKFKNSNADSNDLWNCLSETCNQDIAKIMDNWILKIGFPMVRVKYDEKDNQITFHQTQYKLSCSSRSGYYDERNSNHYCLPINISLRYKSGLISTNKILMNSSWTLINLEQNEKLEAINVNTGCKSLMVMMPDNFIQQMIVENFSFLSDQEKSQYFRNMIFLVKFFSCDIVRSIGDFYIPDGEKINFSDCLSLLKNIKLNADDKKAKLAMITFLSFCLDTAKNSCIEYKGCYNAVKPHIIKIISDIFGETSFSLNSKMKAMDYQLDLSLLNLKAGLEYEEISKKGLKLFDQYKNDPLSIDESLIPLIYSLKTKFLCNEYFATELCQEFKTMLSEISDDNNSRTRGYKITGIGMETPPHLIEEFMNFGLKGKLQDLIFYHRSINIPASKDKLVDYVNMNSESLLKLPLSSRIQLIKSCGNAVSTACCEYLDEIQQTYEDFAPERIFKEVVEKININNKLVKYLAKEASEDFQKFSYRY